MLSLRIARRQEDEHVAIDGVAFEIAFERGAVDLDALDGRRLGAGHRGRHFGLAPARPWGLQEAIAMQAIRTLMSSSCPMLSELFGNHGHGSGRQRELQLAVRRVAWIGFGATVPARRRYSRCRPRGAVSVSPRARLDRRCRRHRVDLAGRFGSRLVTASHSLARRIARGDRIHARQLDVAVRVRRRPTLSPEERSRPGTAGTCLNT